MSATAFDREAQDWNRNGRLDLPSSLTAATVKSCACAGLHALRPDIKSGQDATPGVRTSASRSGPETIALPLLKSRERSPPICERAHSLERVDASAGLGPSPVRVHTQYRAIVRSSVRSCPLILAPVAMGLAASHGAMNARLCGLNRKMERGLYLHRAIEMRICLRPGSQAVSQSTDQHVLGLQAPYSEHINLHPTLW